MTLLVTRSALLRFLLTRHYMEVPIFQSTVFSEILALVRIGEDNVIITEVHQLIQEKSHGR